MKIYGYRSKKAWKMGLATFGYGFVLLIIFMVIIDPSNEGSPSVVVDTEQNKTFVLAFEKEMYAQDERLQNYVKGYTTAMDGLAKGKIDINGAYEATKKAQDAAIQARSNTFKIEIEKSLPTDVRKLLEGARNELATAYNEKASAFQAAMDYLDDQKPSYLQDVRDYTRSSDAFMFSSFAKITDAKIKVGIK